MLVRYYPTHWIPLTQREKGDFIRPTANYAQQFMESLFPELFAEFADDIVTDEGGEAKA